MENLVTVLWFYSSIFSSLSNLGLRNCCPSFTCDFFVCWLFNHVKLLIKVSCFAFLMSGWHFLFRAVSVLYLWFNQEFHLQTKEELQQQYDCPQIGYAENEGLEWWMHIWYIGSTFDVTKAIGLMRLGFLNLFFIEYLRPAFFLLKEMAKLCNYSILGGKNKNLP